MAFFSFGISCVRPGCGHSNPRGAEFCEKCGISLAFNRPAILDGNAWQPAPDELAAFFRFKNLKGFFTKTLHVPPGMKAWVLQDDPTQPVLLLNEGPHTTETLFERMNNFFRSPQGAVLVVKTSSMPVDFAFDDVLSLERLPLKGNVTLRLRVRVGEDPQRPDLAAFRRHFMQQLGTVTCQQLARPDLLGKSVNSALRAYLGTRSIDEMAANPHLSADLDAHLRNRLGALLADLGLELVEPTEFTLRHEKLDAQNRQQGELWLLRREKSLTQADKRQLNDLYDQTEREALRAREMELRRKFLAGELDQSDADLAYAMRSRELAQLERMLRADTKEQALQMGAKDAIDALADDYSAKRRQREQQALGAQYKSDEQQAEWSYLKEVARIRREGALRQVAAIADHDLALQLERAKNELSRLQAEAALEDAKQLADLAERDAALRIGVEALAKAHLRSEQLKDAEGEAAVDAVKLASETKRSESARVQLLEDALLRQKISKIEREENAAKTHDQMAALRQLAELDHLDEQNKLQRELDKKDKEFELQWKARQQQQTHELELKALELRHISLTGTLPMSALVLLADNPAKVEAFVKMATLDAHSKMSADSILASGDAMRPTQAQVPPPAGISAAAMDERIRAVQLEERNLTREVVRELGSQKTEFLDHMAKMTEALRDVGLANAGFRAPTHPSPVIVAPVPVPAPPTVPPTSTVLHQPFVACPHCHSLNPQGGRFCSSCGKSLL